MYNSINYEFKNNSQYLKNQTLYIGFPILYFIIAGLLAYFLKWNLFEPFFLIFIFFGVIIILILISYYGLIIIGTIKNEEEFSWRNIWNVIKITRLYTITVHKKDIALLVKILKNHGVNTRPKVLEVLRHYQCLLPRKTRGGISVISILALSISALALIFNDYVQNSEINQMIVLAVIFGVLLVCLLAYQLNKDIFRYFGENAFNERIEMAISEIWMKSLIK